MKQAVRTIDYRIPPLKTRTRNTRTSGSFSFLAATVWIIFLLTLPTQFVAPLLTGAVNWIPGTDLTLCDAPLALLLLVLDRTNGRTTLENVTVPYFEIHSLDWITAADQVEKNIGHLEGVISNTSAPGPNYGGELNSSRLSDNPFSAGTGVGRLVLVNDIPWTPAPSQVEGVYKYREAEVRTRMQWVVVAL